jgi:hypothetical protein
MDETQKARAGRPEKQGDIETAIKNTIDRPEMREQLRPYDSRERARLRIEQLAGNMKDVDAGGVDEFYISPDEIPDGWSYEWKRFAVFGQEDPHYQTELRRTGWEPVPASRHPDRVPVGSKDQHIMRKGMILMERPLEITEMFRKRDQKAARDQVRVKEEQLTTPPPGQFDRNNKDSSMVKVKKSYSPMPIPE